jgi:hypothetical protein
MQSHSGRYAFLPVLPLLYLVGAWAATTAAGASILLFPGGIDALEQFLGGGVSSEVIDDIGKGVYLALLYLPFIIWPLFGLIGLRATRTALRSGFGRLVPAYGGIDSRWLWAVSAVAAAYCVMKLHTAGGLYPSVLMSGAGFNEQMIERSRLMGEMRFVFYAVVYAVVPALAALFFAKFLERHRWSDLAGFALLYLFFYYLTVAIYLKAPFLVFFLLLTAVVLAARASLFYIPALAVLAVGTFLSMQVMIGGIVSKDPPPPKAGKPSPSVLIKRTDPVGSLYNSAAFSMAKSVIFRMGSAFPFYISIFENPTERCGIEGNRIPFIPSPTCNMPTKVFNRIYPNTTFVQGFAPAGAHVSAYGEIGLGYSLIIMALGGLSVGVLGALSTAGRGPAYAVLMGASCIYGYYLTQVPFLGALTYGHGLVFFLLPIVGLFGLGLLTYSTQAEASTAELTQ